jgi:hypothetical protein
MKGTTGIFKYPALTDSGRIGLLNVRIKVFVGIKTSFRRILILLTVVTPCEDRFSQISSSLTPSKSLDRITPFDELREECAVTLIDMLQSTFDFRRFLEWLSVEHSTKSDPFLNFLTLLGCPAKPSSPFCIAKGDNVRKAASSVDPMTINLGQDTLGLVFFALVIDSSPEDEESETSVRTLFRVLSEGWFLFLFLVMI